MPLWWNQFQLGRMSEETQNPEEAQQAAPETQAAEAAQPAAEAAEPTPAVDSTPGPGVMINRKTASAKDSIKRPLLINKENRISKIRIDFRTLTLDQKR